MKIADWRVIFQDFKQKRRSPSPQIFPAAPLSQQGKQIMSQIHETEREQLKKIALGVAVTIAATVLMLNVARYEVNVMLEIASNEWQRSINQYIFGVFAFITMIIIAVVSGLKESGKKRWAWYGLPIAIILLVLEEFAGYHYFTRLGYDYSENQKNVSLSKKTLESAFEKLDVKNAVVISDSNPGQAEQVLTLNSQAAFAEKKLIGCNKIEEWKKRSECQRIYGSALSTADRKLKAIAEVQAENHQSHSEKMAELNALLKLRETAQLEDKRVIPLPIYSMVISNNETALSFQNGMNWFFATAITVINSGLFFLGVGLLSEVKFSKLKYASPAQDSQNSQPQSFKEGYSKGKVPVWSEIFNRTQSPLGTQTVSQAGVSDHENRISIDTNTKIQRGKYDFKEFANDKVDSNTEKNSDYSTTKIGFSAPVVSTQSVSDSDKRISLDTNTFKNTDTDTGTLKKGVGRKQTDVVLAQSIVKKAILDSSFYAKEKKVGTKSVMRFTRLHDAGVGQDNANLIIANLIDERILDANGNKIEVVK